MSVLTQTARRIKEGDLEVRAQVEGSDEISRLAREFNTMTDSLDRYRKSSLGELLQAQHASQAAPVYDETGSLANISVILRDVTLLSKLDAMSKSLVATL